MPHAGPHELRNQKREKFGLISTRSRPLFAPPCASSPRPSRLVLSPSSLRPWLSNVNRLRLDGLPCRVRLSFLFLFFLAYTGKGERDGERELMLIISVASVWSSSQVLTQKTKKMPSSTSCSMTARLLQSPSRWLARPLVVSAT